MLIGYPFEYLDHRYLKAVDDSLSSTQGVYLDPTEKVFVEEENTWVNVTPSFAPKAKCMPGVSLPLTRFLESMCIHHRSLNENVKKLYTAGGFFWTLLRVNDDLLPSCGVILAAGGDIMRYADHEVTSLIDLYEGICHVSINFLTPNVTVTGYLSTRDIYPLSKEDYDVAVAEKIYNEMFLSTSSASFIDFVVSADQNGQAATIDQTI